jgi:EmrB/QacA subfamily drug resistance transporter
VASGPNTPAPTRFFSQRERRDLFLRIFPSIMIPMYLAIGDQTLLATALPAIVGSLGEAERISWIMSAYLVANTIAAPIYGYIGDVFGRKPLMFIALGLYVGAGVFCYFAPNVWFLIIGRLIQGLGGGGLMALSQALVGEVVPVRERGNFQGYLASIGVVATTVGPILGGYVTQHFGWRYVFLINIPVAILAIGLTFRLKTKPGNKEADWHFDFLGLILFILFVLPVMFALEQAQRISMERLPPILGLFALSAFFFIVLVRHENKVHAPLLPLALFRQRAIWQSSLMVLCQGAMLTSLVTFIPLYMRVVRGADAANTGWLILPLTIGLSIGSILTGRVMSRTGLTMIIPSFTLFPAVLLLIFFSLTTSELSPTMMAWVLGCTAILLGSVMNVAQVTVQSTAGPQKLGAAASSTQFARSVGAAFGTALFSTVLFGILSVQNPDDAQMFNQILDHGPDALNALAPLARERLNAGIALAFQSGFLVSACFVIISMICAWTHPHRKL